MLAVIEGLGTRLKQVFCLLYNLIPSIVLVTANSVKLGGSLHGNEFMCSLEGHWRFDREVKPHSKT